MYLETMQEILNRSNTIVVDDSLKNLMPFLPLNDLPRPTPGPGQASPQSAPQAGSTTPQARSSR